MIITILLGIASIAAQLYAAMRLKTTELFFAVLVVAAAGRLLGVPPGILYSGATLAFILRYVRHVGTGV